jgi:6-phosphogluconolactonase (cycloisomerase 2 family)
MLIFVLSASGRLGQATMGLTKLSMTFGLVAIIGCGGGTPSTATTPPPTPPPPTGPASGTELLYEAGSGSLQAFVLNPQTGVLSAPVNALPDGFLPENQGIPPVASPNGKFLYLQAFDQEDGVAAIYCYSITGTHGELTAIQGVTGPPFIPQYPPAIDNVDSMIMDPKGQNLYLATDDAGGTPSSPAPHSIRQYSIDPTSGALTEQLPYSVTSTAQSSALAIDPSGKYLYAESVLFNSGIGISAFSIDSATGAVTEIPGSPFVANGTITNISGNPEILVSPSGKYLYLNLVDQAYAFSIDASTGALNALSGSPYNLNLPRLETPLLQPNGKFLYAVATVVGSFDLSFSSFPIDTASGAITTTPASVVETSREVGAYTGGTVIDPSGQVLVTKNRFTSLSTFLIDGATGAISTQPGGPYDDGDPNTAGWESATIVKFP